MRAGWFRGGAASAAARQVHTGTGGSRAANLRRALGRDGGGMSAKEKSKVGAPFPSREKEIERLEKDVEELRHLAGDEDADAGLERLRRQVSELRKEFYTHLGPWQRAQIARHQQRPYT